MWPSRLRTGATVAAAAALALLLAGCVAEPTRTTKPQIEYQPDMYVQPYLQALGTDTVNPKLPAMRVPPAHTVPINYTPFPQASDLTSLDQIVNPLPVTPAVLAKGRQLFDTFCIVCHGAYANGLGYIVPHMTQPPPLIAGTPLQFGDGQIFEIITRGQGNMPSYQTELFPAQRWAIIHYVRVLQLAANPSPENMALAQREGMNFSRDLPAAEGPHGPIPGAQAIPH